MACNLSMERMTLLFIWLGILLLSSVSMGKTGSLQCPPLVHVEHGTDGVIACDIGFKFVNLYWYSGDDFSETPPIVRLENGVPEGGEGFDITPNGSLVVLGAEVSLEGIYTVVVFHLNSTYEHSSVSLKTFADPHPYFPLIERCNGMQFCSVKADYPGSVHCAIYDARPAFELDLQSEGVLLVNVTHNSVTDANTGLTNTTIKACYESAECLQLSNITCIATGFEMQEIKSTLTFHGECFPTDSMEPTGKSSAGAAVVITLVIIVVIVIAVVMTLYFFKKQRNDYDPVERSDEEANKNESVRGNKSEVNKKEQRVEMRSVEDISKILQNALSEKYQAHYFGHPWNGEDKIISVDDVYIDLEFEIRDDNDEAMTVKMNDIFEESFLNDKKMRVFVSNKLQLTFSSHFAYLWSKQKTKDKILLVFNMQDVSYDTTIATVIKHMLQDNLLTEDEVDKVIEEVECHIILEGVEFKQIISKDEQDDSHEIEIKSGAGTSSNTGRKTERSPFSQWTIGDILRDYRKEIFHHKIWIITFDQCTAANNVPYSIVQMKDVTLLIDRLDEYIKTAVEYYHRDSNDVQKKKHIKAVREVLLIWDLEKKFGRALILFIQIIHLITKHYVIDYDTYNYVSISSLMTNSLYLLKLRYGKKFPSKGKETLTSLEEHLGEAAYYQVFGKGQSEPMLSEDVIEFSRSIGLIKESSSVSQVKFNTDEVECFFIASYLKSEDTLSDFIRRTLASEASEEYAGSDKRYQILSFICALQPSNSQEICEKIMKKEIQKGRMKYFLNCFCETTDADKLNSVMKEHLETNENAISIFDDKCHLAKIRCLLKYCQKWKISVYEIKFERISQTKSHTTVIRTEKFEMPAVTKITFNRITLEEEETLLYYMEWIVKQNVQEVSFNNCQLPEFSADITFSLKAIFGQNESTVIIRRSESKRQNVREFVLDKKAIKWNKTTDKHSKKKEDTKSEYSDENKAEGDITGNSLEKEATNQTVGKSPREETTEKKLGASQSKPEASYSVVTDLQSSKGSNVPASRDNVSEEETIKSSKNAENTKKVIQGKQINKTNTTQISPETKLDISSNAENLEKREKEATNVESSNRGSDVSSAAKTNEN